MIFEETIAVLFQYLRQFTNFQIQKGQRIPSTRQMKKTVPSMSYSSCLVAKTILEEAEKAGMPQCHIHKNSGQDGSVFLRETRTSPKRVRPQTVSAKEGEPELCA